MYDAIAEEDDFSDKAWDVKIEERNKRFAKEHPEYAAFKSEYDAEYNVYNDLCGKRDKAQSFIDEIQSYLDKIEEHKDYMINNNIAA
jgi:cobalamin biosynthesis protein CobT